MSYRNSQPDPRDARLGGQYAMPLFLAAALLPHIYKLTLPPAELACSFISDDAFYYFKTALNISKGLGSTFDSYNFTNGYHPLWMLVCVLTAFVTRDLYEYVRLIMWVDLLIVLLLSIQIYRMTRSWLGPVFAGLLVCLVNWPISGTFRLFNGLETALFLSLVLLTVKLVVEGSFESSKDMFLLGVTLGAAFLARTSFVLFTPILAGYGIFRYRRGDFRISYSKTACLLVPTCVLVAPYLAWNYLETGHFEQISGLVKDYWGAETSRSSLDYVHAAVRLGGILFSNIGGYDRSMDRWLLYTFNTALGLFIAVMGYRQRVSLSALFKVEKMLLLTGMAASEVCYYYVSYLEGVRHWHLALPVLVIQIAFVFLLKSVYEAEADKPVKKGVLVVAAIALWGLHVAWVPLDHFGRRNMSKALFDQGCGNIRTGDWLRTNVSAQAKIGGANVGKLGYFSDRNVINLDGLGNGVEFLNYLVRGKGLLQYIVDKRIEYVIPDVPNVDAIPARYGYPVERLPINAQLFVYRIRYRDRDEHAGSRER